MTHAAEWRFGKGEHFCIARIFIEAAKAIETQCCLGFTKGYVGNLIEDPS